MQKYTSTAFTFLVSLFLSGCATSVKQPEIISVEGVRAVNATEQAQQPISPWWKQLHSSQLDTLIETALSGNPSIQQLLEKVEQANTVLRAQRARSSPAVQAETGAAIQRGQTESESYSASLSAHYEIDLWQRRNTAIQSAKNSDFAARFDLKAARLSLSAEIVITWLQLQTLLHTLDLSQQSLLIDQQQLSLLNQYFLNGQARANDILKQKQALHAAEVEITSTRLAIENKKNQLATLVGISARSMPEISPVSFSEITELPSDLSWKELLASRPDVQAGWQRFLSADYSAQSADKSRYPTFSISAAISNSSDNLSNLLDDWLWRLAANLVMPLIDGDSYQIEYEKQLSVTRQRLWSYRETVLTAIADVANALANEKYQNHRLLSLLDQRKLIALQLEQSLTGYRLGQSDYRSALSYQASLNTIEKQITEAKRDQLLARISLIRASGGKPLLHKDNL